MRKINQKLKVLMQNGARGNSGEKVGKMFNTNGVEATRALNRNQGAMAYWPMLK